MTKLSNTIDSDLLLQLMLDKNKIRIADFIYERFNERYIRPIKSLNPNEKHGFSIMAVSCLMIESLESFKSGYQDTKYKSRRTFIQFFSTEHEFKEFIGFEESFYNDVRCGILHQSETINGWKIRREGQLFNPVTKTINATEFLNRLEKCLINYTSNLKLENWNSQTWVLLIKKLQFIINNC